MRSQRLAAATFLSILGLSACSDTSLAPLPLTPHDEAMAPFRADDREVPTRSEERSGTFNDFSDQALWAAIAASEQHAVVGLKMPGRNRGFWKGRILMDRSEWAQARQAVVSQPGITFVSADTLLPTVEIRVRDIVALSRVRKLPFVDYVQPRTVDSGLGSIWASGDGTSGCGYNDWSGGLVYTPEGDAYSVSMQRMQIHNAWSRSSGSGVHLGLTDTGISSSQPELANPGVFASGRSGGRSIQYLHTANVGDPWDTCGHGNKMAGQMAAPRNGQNAVGVAWGANLVSVRQAGGVATVDSEAAKSSIRLAAQNIYYRSGGKIITMAWQSLNWLYQVSDEIQYWYYNYPIFFIAAAGTSGCNDGALDGNVVFPADQSEVFAVTGVDGYGYVPCGIHRGSPVQLVAYIPQTATGETAGQVARLSGSSSATATISGVAALVWSRYPWMTRQQLRDRLRYSGSFYPDKDGDRGWGIVNAHKAVGGLWEVKIDGCAQDCEYQYWISQCTTYTYTAGHQGGDGPFSYQWGTEYGVAGNGYSMTRQICPTPYEEAYHSVFLSVTDQSDGTTMNREIRIKVYDPNQPCPTCPL